MRVTLERSNLLKSLNHVHRVVERRNTIPILSNVLLKAEGATLDMKATDLDLEITEATPAMIEQAGATTVPAHLLYDIVRKLPDGSEVLLSTDADGNVDDRGVRPLEIQAAVPAAIGFSGSDRGRLQPYVPAARNAAEDADRPHPVRDLDRRDALLSQRHLRHIRSKARARSKLRAVATDGHRLARADVDAPSGSEGMPGIIIPRKTVGELQKLVDNPDVTVTVELSDAKIRFTIGAVVLTSKLIDGTFPDYQRVIPTGNDKD
jgi:DNA polymerase-3 subunit beta